MKRKSAVFMVLFLSLLMTCAGCGNGPAQSDTTNTNNNNNNNTVISHSISGVVTGASGGVPGVTMTLSGAASAVATTDTGGNFSFSGLANGSYTIAPSKTNYTFTPAQSTESVSDADITGVNFTVATVSGVSLYDGTYTGTWTKTCPACSITSSTGTFSAIVSEGAFTDVQFTLTSGDSGIKFDSGSVSTTGAITGYGASPSQCSTSPSTFSGQITISSSNGADMSINYSRTSSPEGCEAESGTITATRN